MTALSSLLRSVLPIMAIVRNEFAAGQLADGHTMPP